MKEKEINEFFSAIQLEEGDDFDLFSKAVGTNLCEDKDGKIYCIYYVHLETRVVAFDSNKKAWIPLKEEEIDKLDFSKMKSFTFQESLEFYKKYPPFDVLNDLRDKKAIKRLERILKLRKTTTHKVIGWVNETLNRKVANDVEDSYFAAVINDIVDHSYFFFGDRIELFPVFEDNTYIDYSSRTWGDIIALSRNEAGDYDYSLYAWQTGDYKDLNEPTYGFYEELEVEKEVDPETFSKIEKYVANFYELSEEESANYYGSRYLLLINECEFYDQIGKIKITCNGKTLYFSINPPFYVESLEDFNQLSKDLAKDFDFDILVLGDFDKIKEKLKSGPAFIVLLHE